MITNRNGPLRVGIGGPVGSGKTALTDALCKALRDRYAIAAITNDIYTREDAEFLTRSGALVPDRIVGVETGGCPHTAIREDASINLSAFDRMTGLFPRAEICFIESGGDNLASTFSLDLVDWWMFVIDVAQGDDIPRKRGPAILQADLLVINKIDLAPYVGVDADAVLAEAKEIRGNRPTIACRCRGIGDDPGLAAIVDTIHRDVLFTAAAVAE